MMIIKYSVQNADVNASIHAKVNPHVVVAPRISAGAPKHVHANAEMKNQEMVAIKAKYGTEIIADVYALKAFDVEGDCTSHKKHAIANAKLCQVECAHLIRNSTRNTANLNVLLIHQRKDVRNLKERTSIGIGMNANATVSSHQHQHHALIWNSAMIPAITNAQMYKNVKKIIHGIEIHANARNAMDVNQPEAQSINLYVDRS